MLTETVDTLHCGNSWTDSELAEYGLIATPAVPRVDFPVTVPDLLAAACSRFSDREALVDALGRLTYASLPGAVEAAAAALWSLGLRPRDRLVASAPNSVEYVVAFLAAQRLGLIWVGVNRALAPAEKHYVIEDAQATVVLADPGTVDALRNLPSPPTAQLLSMAPGEGSDWSRLIESVAEQRAPLVKLDPAAPAGIAYTSGTTGNPKGAVHSLWNLMLFVAMVPRWRPSVKPGVRLVVTLPLTTLNMMVLDVLPCLANGGTCITLDKVDTVTLAKWIGREQVTAFTTVPAIAHDLLTSALVAEGDLATLEAPIVGASMVPDALRARYRQRFGNEVQTGYGLTEAPSTVSSTTLSPGFVPNSTGRALAHLEVSIRNPDGEVLPHGETGEVCVGPHKEGWAANLYRTMLGYWRRPDATAASLAGGVLHTGDLGRLDENGELFIVDRSSDLIIRGGNNVYPAEIERLLSADSRVNACAVIGVPDERLGQKVGALIQPMPGVDAAQLIADLKAILRLGLARYKQPDFWAVVDQFARNQMGKIVKRSITLPAQWRSD